MPGKIEGRGSAYDLTHNTTLTYWRDDAGNIGVGIEHHIGTVTQEVCTTLLYLNAEAAAANNMTLYTLTQEDPPTIQEQIECTSCAHAGFITDGVFFPRVG